MYLLPSIVMFVVKNYVLDVENVELIGFRGDSNLALIWTVLHIRCSKMRFSCKKMQTLGNCQSLNILPLVAWYLCHNLRPLFC